MKPWLPTTTSSPPPTPTPMECTLPPPTPSSRPQIRSTTTAPPAPPRPAQPAQARPGRRRRARRRVGRGGGVAASSHKTVSLTVDGQPQEVGTFAGSVEGALDSAGLTVPSTTPSPRPSTPPSPTARRSWSSVVGCFTLTIDGKTREVWTTADTVEEALAELGQNPAAFKLSADRNREIPTDGLTVQRTSRCTAPRCPRPARRPVPVKSYRQDRRRPAQGAQDRARAAGHRQARRRTPRSPTGSRSPVTRVSKTKIREAVAVAQPADQQVQDDSLDAGTTTVTEQGSAARTRSRTR